MLLADCRKSQGNLKGAIAAVRLAIKRAREDGGPFRDLWDFCARVDSRAVNKKAIEALIKCGAFGSTGATRKGMLEVQAQAQAAGQKSQQDALIGQGSIFDLEPQDSQPAATAQPAPALLRLSSPPIPGEEFDQAELLTIIRRLIG